MLTNSLYRLVFLSEHCKYLPDIHIFNIISSSRCSHNKPESWRGNPHRKKSYLCCVDAFSFTISSKPFEFKIKIMQSELKFHDQKFLFVAPSPTSGIRSWYDQNTDIKFYHFSFQEWNCFKKMFWSIGLANMASIFFSKPEVS